METVPVSFPNMLPLKTLCAGNEEGWADQKAVKVLDSSSSCCYFCTALEAAGSTKIKPFFFFPPQEIIAEKICKFSRQLRQS